MDVEFEDALAKCWNRTFKDERLQNTLNSYDLRLLELLFDFLWFRSRSLFIIDAWFETIFCYLLMKVDGISQAWPDEQDVQTKGKVVFNLTAVKLNVTRLLDNLLQRNFNTWCTLNRRHAADFDAIDARGVQDRAFKILNTLNTKTPFN